MTINTGLTVICDGHLISLERDEERKVARVIVKMIPDHVLTGLEGNDLQCAADLLMRRAQRFLGGEWRVLRWNGAEQQTKQLRIMGIGSSA